MMKNPPHPGEGIKDGLQALQLTTAQAAKALGVTRQLVHRGLTGQSSISPDMALRLDLVIGSAADHWLRLQAPHDLAKVRRRTPQITMGSRSFHPA